MEMTHLLMLIAEAKEYNKQQKIKNMVNSLAYFGSEDTKKILDRLKSEFGIRL